MKKIFLLISLALNAVFAVAQNSSNTAGWITIDLNDFMCTKATEDDPLNFDGYGDEVYFITFYSVANQFGVTKYVNKTVSNIYGDTYRFSNRIAAGHANPDSRSGGLNSGSQFFVGKSFPNLKKIRVEAGDFITIIPTIWEWDNESNAQLQASFESRLLNSFNDINLKMVPMLQYNNGYSRSYEFTNYAALSIPLFADILSPVLNKSSSRPIGLKTNGELAPIVFALNANIIKNQRSNSLVTDGKYNMNYVNFTINEDALGNTAAHGIYDLRYHFMYEEDFTKPTAQAPSNSKIRPIKKDVTAITTALFTIAGKWTGSQTNDAGLYPQAVSFTLNSKGEIIMANEQTGAVAAKGTYSFANNIINGSYKLLSSNETISFTGSYDPASKKMSCSLGMGASTTGQGKWIMNKQ